MKVESYCAEVILVYKKQQQHGRDIHKAKLRQLILHAPIQRGKRHRYTKYSFYCHSYLYEIKAVMVTFILLVITLALPRITQESFDLTF